MEQCHHRRDELFWAKVTYGPVPEFNSELGNCLLWQSTVNATGYAIFWGAGAHTYLVGRAPKGLQWDHLCRVPTCVRPSHLELVTPRENALRGLRGRLAPVRTHCKHGHELTPENVRINRRGDGRTFRVCITCDKGWQHARYI